MLTKDGALKGHNATRSLVRVREGGREGGERGREEEEEERQRRSHIRRACASSFVGPTQSSVLPLPE